MGIIHNLNIHILDTLSQCTSVKYMIKIVHTICKNLKYVLNLFYNETEAIRRYKRVISLL